MSKNAYEELINSALFQKHLEEHVRRSLNGNAVSEEDNALDIIAREKAAEDIKKDSLMKFFFKPRVLKDETRISDASRWKVFYEDIEKQALETRTKREKPVSLTDTPEEERHVASQFETMLLKKLAREKVIAMLKDNAVPADPKKLKEAVKKYTDKLYFEEAVSKKTASYSEKEKAVIAHEFTTSMPDERKTYIDCEIKKQDIKALMNDPQKKDMLAQFRLDNKAAQTAKKAGLRKNINDVFTQVKETRVAEETKQAEQEHITSLKEERKSKNLAMLEAIKKNLGAKR